MIRRPLSSKQWEAAAKRNTTRLVRTLGGIRVRGSSTHTSHSKARVEPRPAQHAKSCHSARHKTRNEPASSSNRPTCRGGVTRLTAPSVAISNSSWLCAAHRTPRPWKKSQEDSVAKISITNRRIAIEKPTTTMRTQNQQTLRSSWASRSHTLKWLNDSSSSSSNHKLYFKTAKTNTIRVSKA